jgi:hypothetical protein
MLGRATAEPEALGVAMATGFWPDAHGLYVTEAAFLVGVVAILVERHASSSPSLVDGVDPQFKVTFAESERDRRQSLAKGEAATASTFLLAILTALVEDKISDKLPPFYLLSCVAGIVGMLMLAAQQSRDSAEHFAQAAPPAPPQGPWGRP